MKSHPIVRHVVVGLAATITWLGSVAPASAAYQLLHEFRTSTSVPDGYYPTAPLTFDGTSLFGATSANAGATASAGTIFRIDPDGTDYEILHTFTGGSADAGRPLRGLTLSGSTLFGTAEVGGLAGLGAVYRINTDGSGYQLIHQFANASTDGATPRAKLAISGSTLYGTTAYGGAFDLGTVFKIGVDGTGFQVLHSFAGGASDGAEPWTGVSLVGSTLYGTTYRGGDGGNGTVFKIGTDGSGFGLLHEFAGGVADGRGPASSVTVSGSMLYGMTQLGGAASAGTVFAMDMDGSNYQLLHSFYQSLDDGSLPVDDLTVHDGALYGTTTRGNADLGGTVFKIGLDGSNYQIVHSFAGPAADGERPSAAVTFVGNTMFGTTFEGGAADLGVIFALDVSPPIPGDFDKDGDVDRDDLPLWRSAFNLTDVGDADFDGDSDGADFLIWQRNLGMGTGTLSAVPEPVGSTGVLLAVTLPYAVVRRRLVGGGRGR